MFSANPNPAGRIPAIRALRKRSFQKLSASISPFSPRADAPVKNAAARRT